jgi:hypothetical protein
MTKERAAYWDGKNNLSEHISSGIYFYEIEAGVFRAVKKMVMLKLCTPEGGRFLDLHALRGLSQNSHDF